MTSDVDEEAGHTTQGELAQAWPSPEPKEAHTPETIPGQAADHGEFQPPQPKRGWVLRENWGTIERGVAAVVALAAVVGSAAFLSGCLALWIWRLRTGSQAPPLSQVLSSLGFFGTACSGAEIIFFVFLTLVPMYISWEGLRSVWRPSIYEPGAEMLDRLASLGQELTRFEQRGIALGGRIRETGELLSKCESCEIEGCSMRSDEESPLRQKGPIEEEYATYLGELASARQLIKQQENELFSFLREPLRGMRRWLAVSGAAYIVTLLVVLLFVAPFEQPKWTWVVVGSVVTMLGTFIAWGGLFTVGTMLSAAKRMVAVMVVAFVVLVVGQAIMCQPAFSPREVAIQFQSQSPLGATLLFQTGDGIWYREQTHSTTKFAPVGSVVAIEYPDLDDTSEPLLAWPW